MTTSAPFRLVYRFRQVSCDAINVFSSIVCCDDDALQYKNSVITNNSYLQFKFQLPTSDTTQITAGGRKVPIEGFVPLDAP